MENQNGILDPWAIGIPLAYRPMVLKLANNLLDRCGGSIMMGISPSDHVLTNNTHSTINLLIKKCFNRRHIPFSFVGEWAPDTHRWHYHGIVKITDMGQLDKLKRSLARQIGRTVSGPIHDETAYSDYMVKIYVEPIVMKTVQPLKDDSVVTNQFIYEY